MNPETRNFSSFQKLAGQPLPIFTRGLDDLTLFYAPGYLTAAMPDTAREISGVLRGDFPFSENMQPHYLIQAAVSAGETWRRLHSPGNYQPTCLTLYTGLKCNLACIYCFAAHSRGESRALSKKFIMESARTVLRNCQELSFPFTAVFHGGGEPTLDDRMPDLLAELRTMCSENHVPFRSYLATNGVMSAGKARFLAKIFAGVGLSVDGPPDIQNRQRPTQKGTETAGVVERTAGIIREIQGRLTVRVTVLPENFVRIPEIAAYCSDVLHADEIRLEPAYHQRTDPALAEEFCHNFLKAGKDVRLSYSGSRIGEIHGRYCQDFRQVLHLVPPEGYSNCFTLSSQKEAGNSGLDDPWDGSVFDRLSAEDPECEDCFNRLHCTRGCPDICPRMTDVPQDAGTFRCLVNRTLAEAELLDIARRELTRRARMYGYAGVKLRGDL